MPVAIRRQVEAALANKPVRLVRIEATSARASAEAAAPEVSVEELASLAPSDFFERLYRHRFGNEPPDELMQAFSELLHAPADEGGQ